MAGINAIITGAAGNLGRAITSTFLDAGYNVHAIISHIDNISFLSRTGLSVYQADLMFETETSSVLKDILNKAENIDFVIMTVGGYAPGSLKEVTDTDFEKMFRLNFLTAFNVARSVLPYMEKQKTTGKLVFIGARPGLNTEEGTEMVAYTLSKSLVFRLSEIINKVERKNNIKSFVVVPTTIDTPQNRTAMPDADFTKWVKPEVIAEQILNIDKIPDYKLNKNILKIY
jgi:NAD(P)-dependent dehydrogenase (short-subunit alcohol dehydrogenase family)